MLVSSDPSTNTLPTSEGSSYTTAGRHRRDVAPGRIRLRVPALRAGAPWPALLVNGWPVEVRATETVIQLPPGPVLLEVSRPGDAPARAVRVELVLEEGADVDVRLVAPRLGPGPRRLLVSPGPPQAV